MDGIRYAPVNGFPGYIACSEGYIINNITGNILSGTKKKTGYKEVQLYDEKHEVHHLSIHRVIASAFCEKRAGASEVNHRDGDKDNNRADNLEWVTHEENLRHAFETGLRENDVTPRPVIATNMETGEKVSFSSIYKAARFLGISQGNICMCCKGIRPYAGGYFWEYKEGE